MENSMADMTPEELKRNEENSTQQEAEIGKLIKGGAEMKGIVEINDPELIVTRGQKVAAHAEMNREIKAKQEAIKESRKKITESFRENGAKYKIYEHKRHLLLNQETIEKLRKEMEADIAIRNAKKVENGPKKPENKPETGNNKPKPKTPEVKPITGNKPETKEKPGKRISPDKGPYNETFTAGKPGKKISPEGKPSKKPGSKEKPGKRISPEGKPGKKPGSKEKPRKGKEINPGGKGKEGKENDPRKKEKIEQYLKRAKRYGIHNPAILGMVANAAGSIFGLRSFWEVPKYIDMLFNKHGLKKETDKLLGTIIERNKDFKKGKEEGEAPSTKVRERIAAFDERLKNLNLPEKQKLELRGEMAKIIWEHRHESRKLSSEKEKKIQHAVEVYTDTSAEAMTVGREVVNTLCIGAAMPLRGVGYIAFAGLEKIARAKNEYEKKHLNDKENKGVGAEISAVTKEVTVNAVSRGWNSIVNGVNAKGEHLHGWQRVKESGMTGLKVGLGALTLFGALEYANALASGNKVLTEGGEQIAKLFREGNIPGLIAQGGVNIYNNILRVFGLQSASEGAKMFEAFKGGKEGVENPIIRLLLKNVEKYSHMKDLPAFTGNIKDPRQTAEWAQKAAHLIAQKDGFVKEAIVNGKHVVQELWVKGMDLRKGAGVVLNPDGSAKVLNTDLYKHFNTALKAAKQAYPAIGDRIKGLLFSLNTNTAINTAAHEIIPGIKR